MTIWLVINVVWSRVEKTFSAEADAVKYAELNGDDGSYHSTKDPLMVVPVEFYKDEKGKNRIKTFDSKKAHADYEREAMADFLKRFPIK